MLSVFYWILLLLWLVFGIVRHGSLLTPQPGQPVVFWPVAGDVFLFILFVLIGLKLFGFSMT